MAARKKVRRASVRTPEEWSEWVEWLATGLHGRSRWRLPLVLVGLAFAGGRRTVTSWLRAAGIEQEFSGYYYFISSLGRKSTLLAARLFRLLLDRLAPTEPTTDGPEGCVVCGLDDSPTKRYGPKVQGAGIHHNPTPGPADQKYVYGHVWVTLVWIVRHPLWQAIGLPLLSRLYVRRKNLGSIPKKYGWEFHTKLELAADLVLWAARLLKWIGKRLCVVTDGAYAKWPFLGRVLAEGVTVISRLRKDAALRSVPPPRKPGTRGRPRKYGAQRISLAKRAGQKQGWKTVDCLLYGGRLVTKKYKTFLATYRPAGGLIRVVLVKELHGWVAFFCTDPNASVPWILERFADRMAIEQDFHDVKEVWGAGQQQVRNIWCNIGVWHLNLWMHSLVELWAWDRPQAELTDRSDSPWDDPARRPSHADRRKAFRRACLERELSPRSAARAVPPKIAALLLRLLKAAA